MVHRAGPERTESGMGDWFEGLIQTGSGSSVQGQFGVGAACSAAAPLAFYAASCSPTPMSSTHHMDLTCQHVLHVALVHNPQAALLARESGSAGWIWISGCISDTPALNLA